MDIDKEYNSILISQLEKRLGRPALESERVNADNDSDLVNETLWQLVVKINDRLNKLGI